MKLNESFYKSSNVLNVSQALLGKLLYSYIDGQVTAGIIVETEAYSWQNDRACHAYKCRRTKRNETMFASGGVAYVYLCYGLHYMLNIVTNDIGKADAVLIRALEPKIGLNTIKNRRRLECLDFKSTSGPGKLCQALGITLNHNGESLLEDKLWLENTELAVPKSKIRATKRIGIDFAGPDADKKWRFFIKDNPYVSHRLR